MCAERNCHYRPSGISCLCGYDIAGVENIWYRCRHDGRPSPVYHPGWSEYQPCNVSVEGDYSQAAFYLAYNTICLLQGKAGYIDLKGLQPHSLQGDRAAANILQRYSQPGELEIDVSGIPDLVPALAAAAAFRAGSKTGVFSCSPSPDKGK